MKQLITLSLAILISFSVYSQGFSNKQGGNCYTIDMPDYMSKTYDLNDVASLQYQNTSREAYVIVIEDIKDQLESTGLKFMNPSEIMEFFISDYMKDAKKRKVSSITEFMANGYNHAQVELKWKDDDSDFYMLITFVESNTHFYRIMCWTIQENTEKLKNDFLMISKSLKE